MTIHFLEVRKKTEEICSHLETEDYSVQPIIDVSPPKWHLAHSTWFFEQFVLVPYLESYTIFHADYAYLFNSYYNNMGTRVLRPNRGLMTRPTVKDVYAYRKHVTEAMITFLSATELTEELTEILQIGINHEQQHQELLQYDIKYILGHQPSFPAYNGSPNLRKQENEQYWASFSEGIYEIGYQGHGFSFDNEHGIHKVYLPDFKISNHVVTNGEFLEFIQDGGYQDFNLWHAEGWDFIQKNDISAPLYWYFSEEKWMYYNGHSFCEVDPNLPLMHVSYYEAFAFAEWKGMRLPTEFEWEAASTNLEWGQVWEWTGSAYLPYPNFSKQPGAIGEYNGKFMVSQHVLRGGSIGTAEGHTRPTYRNFFHPNLRWHFAGIRLAK